VRTHDVGVATIRYDNGLTKSATTLTEALSIQRERSSAVANGVLSLVQDGHWGVQGTLAGTRFSPPINVSSELGPLVRTIRGEMSLEGTTTAQQGLMPSLQFYAFAMAHLMDVNRGAWAGGGAAQTFDGESWTTTMVGEAGGWLRRGSTIMSAIFRPMQLASGDLLGDNEASIRWTHAQVGFELSSGVRLGQAQRGTVAWVSGSVARPVWRDMLMSLGVGSYPADLLQKLPGGRYVSLSLRLPTKRPAPNARAIQPRDSASRALPDVPNGIVAAFETPIRGRRTRVLRVRAAGARRVEVMADFTDWEAIPLVRGLLNEWELTIAIDPGVHRFNLRIDGRDLVVPVNVGQADDDFVGRVGVIVLP
jgi:hypothetical protein